MDRLSDHPSGTAVPFLAPPPRAGHAAVACSSETPAWTYDPEIKTRKGKKNRIGRWDGKRCGSGRELRIIA